MLISDLDYLNTLVDSEIDPAVKGGFYNSPRVPLNYFSIFDRKFKQDKFIGRSRGGYVTNSNGDIVGIFSSSKTSSSSI